MKNALGYLESVYLFLSAIAYSITAIYLAGFIGQSSTPNYMSGSLTSNLPPELYVGMVVLAVIACVFALAMGWLHIRGKRIGKIAFWFLALANLAGFAAIRGVMANMEGKYASRSTYIAAFDTVGVPLLVITLVVILAILVRPTPTGTGQETEQAQ